MSTLVQKLQKSRKIYILLPGFNNIFSLIKSILKIKKTGSDIWYYQENLKLEFNLIQWALMTWTISLQQISFWNSFRDILMKYCRGILEYFYGNMETWNTYSWMTENSMRTWRINKMLNHNFLWNEVPKNCIYAFLWGPLGLTAKNRFICQFLQIIIAFFTYLIF